MYQPTNQIIMKFSIFKTITLITPLLITGCSSFNHTTESSQQANSAITTSDRIASDGLKQLMQGNFEPASAAFNQALKLSPDRAQYTLRGLVVGIVFKQGHSTS
jgi:Tfp pilus assembly protein PilF